jgi:hypothetical protein
MGRRWTSVAERVAIGALALLAACSGGQADQRAAESAAVARAVAGADSVAAAGRDTTVCPKDGRWHPCGIEDRLKRAGLVPHVRPDTARLPFLTPVGQVWTVSKAELRVFLYDDPAQALREAQALDRIRVAPRGESYAWPLPATLIQSGNMVAVLLSENARQAERVQLALEAGPSQTETPDSAPRAPQALPPATSH